MWSLDWFFSICTWLILSESERWSKSKPQIKALNDKTVVPGVSNRSDINIRNFVVVYEFIQLAFGLQSRVAHVLYVANVCNYMYRTEDMPLNRK